MGGASKAARLALKKQRKAARLALKTGAGAAAAKRRATAKLAQEKAAAALKAQEEAAPELALWRLKVGGVVGTVGTVKLPSRTLAAVHRVVNPVLQTAYERKKEALAARLGAANVNERFLFHGTSMANSDGIIHSNFCPSKAGASGAYGRGFYFSADFNFAAEYADRHTDSGALLLCKVLVGRSHCMEGRYNQGCQRQPNFDSHVSHSKRGPKTHAIVVFEPEQVLPVHRVYCISS